MKKYLLCTLVSFSFLVAEEQSQVSDQEGIRQELLDLYETEPQLRNPVFSPDAHYLLELQKISADTFWAWYKQYVNSYTNVQFFRATAQEAPQTIAYLQEIAQKMGLKHVPDLYLGKQWNLCNVNASQALFQNSFVQAEKLLNIFFLYAVATETQEKFHLPILVAKELLPTLIAVASHLLIKVPSRIYITDVTSVIHRSEIGMRQTLAHECGHLKHKDILSHTLLWRTLYAGCLAATYYSLQNSRFLKFFTDNIMHWSAISYSTMGTQTGFLVGKDQKSLTENIVLMAVATFIANNLRDLVFDYVSRQHELRADLESARIVGFENALQALHEKKEVFEPNVERDFALMPVPDCFCSWLFYMMIKKNALIKEWWYMHSPFRTHPTWQQRIDYIKQRQLAEQQVAEQQA